MVRMWPEQLLNGQVTLGVYHVSGTMGTALHKDTEVLVSESYFEHEIHAGIYFKCSRGRGLRH